MGRKSALSPEQWANVEHRHIVGGESINALAKEFGVNESSLRRKISAKASEQAGTREKLEDLAARKVKADKAMKEVTAEIDALPVVRQMIVSDLARKLSAISTHVASTGEYMSAAMHRLSAITSGVMDKIDDVDPMNKPEYLQQAAALIKLTNEASVIPMGLLKANQQAIDNMNKVDAEEVPAGLGHFYGE